MTTSVTEKNMSEDDWVSVAMLDDLLVARILLKLSQTVPFNRARSTGSGAGGIASSPAALQLDWSVRQRRSKHVLRKKKSEPNRASPTTPLYWSGGTSSGSGSGGGGRFEDSGLPFKGVDTASSKVLVPSEAPTTKRSRRKKTLTELKEEESSLLNERRNLRNQLENLRLSIEKQKAANECLKRRKLDLEAQKITTVAASAKTEEFNRNQPQQIKGASDPTYSILPISAAHDKIEMSLHIASPHTQEVECWEPSSILPDLNLPMDDHSSSDVLCGTS